MIIKLYPSWSRRRNAVLLVGDRDSTYTISYLAAILETTGLDEKVEVYVSKNPCIAPEHIRFLSNLHEKLIIAYTLRTTSLVWSVDCVREVVRAPRSLSNTVVVAGGPHASGDPAGTLGLGFNYVFHGEAEHSLPAFIMEYLDSSFDARSIPNLFYQEDGGVRFTFKSRVDELDYYKPFPTRAGWFTPIEIVRGCPFACRFCQVSYMFGCKPRFRSVDSILEYSRIMLESGFRDLRFIAPNSLGYGSRSGFEPEIDVLEELLSRLYKLARGYGGRLFIGSFPSEVRPEFICSDTIRLLEKYAYNKRVVIGAQSGSNEVLRLMHRMHSIEDVYNAVEQLVSRGFRVDVDFILGLPGESDYRETVNAMERIVRLGGVVHIHYFMPLPGTPLAGCNPSSVPGWVLKWIARETGRGRVYGCLERQMEITRRIIMLREEGVFRMDKCILSQSCPA